MRINELTTKDVLKYLPLADEVREKLLAVYPEKVTYEQGVQIEDTTWRLFYAYFDMVYDTVLRKETLENPGPLEPGYHDRLLQKTEDLIMGEYQTDMTNDKLDELRKQLTLLAH
jgi:hypothetical protein